MGMSGQCELVFARGEIVRRVFSLCSPLPLPPSPFNLPYITSYSPARGGMDMPCRGFPPEKLFFRISISANKPIFSGSSASLVIVSSPRTYDQLHGRGVAWALRAGVRKGSGMPDFNIVHRVFLSLGNFFAFPPA